MSLLRDDRLLALHDLVEACRSSASHCTLVAEVLPDDPRAQELLCLAEERNRAAEFFGARMVAEDDIPEGPPEERSLLQTALASAKSILADGGAEALLADCRVQEEIVLEKATGAQDKPLRDDEKAAAAALAAAAGHRLMGLLRI
jgi:hypothetical protein